MGPDFKEVITFPLIIYSTPLRDPNGFLASNSQVGVPSGIGSLEIAQVETSATLELHIFASKPWIKMWSKTKL
jgi:hypothetical protein